VNRRRAVLPIPWNLEIAQATIGTHRRWIQREDHGVTRVLDVRAGENSRTNLAYLQTRSCSELVHSLFVSQTPARSKRAVQMTARARNSDSARADRARVGRGRLHPVTEAAPGWPQVARRWNERGPRGSRKASESGSFPERCASHVILPRGPGRSLPPRPFRLPLYLRSRADFFSRPRINKPEC